MPDRVAQKRKPGFGRSVASQEIRFARVHSGARIGWARTGHGSTTLVRAAHWMTHVEHDAVSEVWKPWLERLGRDMTLLRYDARGCGLSGKDDVRVTLDAAVEELEVVVEASGADRFALLGISAGAATSIAYAARHPERVSHLIVLGGYSHGVQHRPRAKRAVEYHEALCRVIELGWGRADPGVRQFLTNTMLPTASPLQIRALNEQQRKSCDGARAAATLRASAEADVRPFAASLTVPTLVLHGEGDRMVPAELGRELAAAIPGARFQTLPTNNHVPLADEPAFERFCDAIAELVGARRIAPPFDVTARERALLDAVADGLDNSQIAARLDVAEKTVRNALSRLYARLGVEGRPQAIVRAREMGFGRD